MGFFFSGVCSLIARGISSLSTHAAFLEGALVIWKELFSERQSFDYTSCSFSRIATGHQYVITFRNIE